MKPAPAPEADVDLLAKYREGDSQAFRQLVELYRDRMVQFFYRLCWDRDRAEDLAQDMFVKLLLCSKRYRPEGRMATFIYRVAKNLWIDEYRKLKPRPKLFSYDQPLLPNADRPRGQDYAGDDEAPVDRLQDNEERAALRHGLESLSEPHRIVFELAVYQERPYAEIAELLGIPVGTVKSRMHNAVAALRQMLGQGGDATHGEGAADADRRAGGAS